MMRKNGGKCVLAGLECTLFDKNIHNSRKSSGRPISEFSISDTSNESIIGRTTLSLIFFEPEDLMLQNQYEQIIFRLQFGILIRTGYRYTRNTDSFGIPIHIL
uniref:Uncharacterized protein n=1 Tax=Romanomermis culicivorax TaxID=13658 RepID=A0A915JD04_ROMCU